MDGVIFQVIKDISRPIKCLDFLYLDVVKKYKKMESVFRNVGNDSNLHTVTEPGRKNKRKYLRLMKHFKRSQIFHKLIY
jgi:hypothetical protein